MPTRISLRATTEVTERMSVSFMGLVIEVEGAKLTGLILVEGDAESAVGDDALDVGGKVVDDFQRQVSERLLGALDSLTRIRLSECDAQVVAYGLQFTGGMGWWDFRFGGFGEGVEVKD